MSETQPASIAGPIPPPTEQRIHLRILSPGTAIPETVDIRDVPLSTTIQALKQRICLVAPSHPPPSAQRLIFAGRLLANEQASLTQALGAEAIRNNDLLTLHMIARDHSTDGTTRPITRSGTPSGTRMSRESSSRGQDGRITNQLPPGHQEARMFAPPAFPLANGVAPMPSWPPEPGTPHMSMYEQARERDRQAAQVDAQELARDLEFLQQGLQPRPMNQPQHPGIASHLQHHAAMHQAALRQAAMAQQQQQQQQQPRVVVGGTYHWNFVPRQPGQDPGANSLPANGVPANAQQGGNATVTPAPHHQPTPMGVPMHMPMPNIHGSTTRIPMIPHTPMLASTALAQSLANIRAREQLLLAPADMYLVSSPRGPQAVVYHESGTYQAHLPGLATAPVRPTPTTQPVAQSVAAQPAHNPQPEQGQANQQGRPAAPVAPNAQQQPGALQAANNAAPAAANQAAAPNALINHFWTLFRVLVFAYFLLGHDQGWRRPLILLMLAVGFIMLRTMDANGALRNAVRGWWNGIVGVPGRRAGADAQPANAAQHAQPQAANPAPAQHEDNMSPLRRRLRPIEQAAALFVASLWPGVGENTIRQRREAEAQQRREEAEAATAAAEEARTARERAAAELQEAQQPANEESAAQEQGTKTGGVTVSGADQESTVEGVRERKTFPSDAEGSGQPSVS